MKLTLKNTALRLVTLADAAFILQLRTNDTLGQFLNKTDNDVAKQQQWLTAYKAREAAGEEYYFIIETSDTRESIGTVRIYNMQEHRYTSGSWIIKKGAPEEAASLSDYMVTYFGFQTLNFDQCYFDVRKDNKKVLAFHKRFATYVAEDDENIYMVMERAGFQKKKAFFERVLGISEEEAASMVLPNDPSAA